MGEQDSKQNSTSADRSVKNEASREKPAEATKPLFIDVTEESGAFNARNEKRAGPPNGRGARQIGRSVRRYKPDSKPADTVKPAKLCMSGRVTSTDLKNLGMIDATDEGAAIQIIGVPPKKWLKKHGYVNAPKSES